MTEPRLVPVSPARVNAYSDCPRRYRLKYLDKAPETGGPWAHLDVGNAVHLALAEWWALPLAQRTPDAAERLVTAAWKDRAFRDREHSERYRRAAVVWVRAYLERLDPRVEPVGVERRVATRERGMALEGRADRIDQRGPRLAVVDYKVGRRTPDDWNAGSSIALAIYALAVGRMFGIRCDRAELHHIPTGEVAEVVYDAARIGRHMERLREEVDDIVMRTDSAVGAAPEDADDLFPTRPGPLCASCPFRPRCPDGQAVPAAEPWEYLQDPDTLTPGAAP